MLNFLTKDISCKMAEGADSYVGSKRTNFSSDSSDLELVEKVFLKFVLADTDEKLEKSLSTFLAPVLLKLGSKSEAVKNKVIELLTHVNKRIKSRPNIKLPVDSLLQQYENFTMVYIKMGFSRLELTEQLELVPRMFRCMKQRSRQQQEMLFHLIIPLLSHLKLPDDVERQKSILSFYDDMELCTFILEFMKDFLFLPYSDDNASNGSQSSDVNSCPPGLSKASYQRLKNIPQMTSTQIENAKLGILNTLSSGVFVASAVVIHFLVSTGDGKHSVADKGEHCLKKLSSSSDWEENEIIDELFKVFQGTVLGRANPKQAPTTDQIRSPASLRLKLKIFPYFLRSKTAANRNPAGAIKVIFESLFGEATNTRMKKYAIEFCHHICHYGSAKTISFMAPLLYQAFVKIISNKKEESKLRGLSYSGLGKLAKRDADSFKRDIGIVQNLFNSLEEEEKDVILSVQEALSMIAPAYREITGTDAQLMEALIFSNLDKESSLSRLSALQFANAVFPMTHVPSRYACLLSSADKKDDIREEANRGLKPQYENETDSEKSIAKYPSFVELSDYLHIKTITKVKDANENVLVFPSPIFEKILTFLGQCLYTSANVTKQQLATGDTLVPISEFLNSLIQDVDDVKLSCVGRYVAVLKLALVPTADATLHTVALQSLLEVSAAMPKIIQNIFISDLVFIKSFMKAPKDETRVNAGRIFSIILESAASTEFAAEVLEMLENMKSKSFDIQHGSMVGAAYCIARRKSHFDEFEIQDLDAENGENLELLVKKATTAIALKLADSDVLLRSASCQAVGEIGRFIPLPFPDESVFDNNELVEMPEKKMKTENGNDTIVTKEFVTKHLISLLDSKDTKVKEKAALSLGYIMVGDPQHPYKDRILNALFSTSKARQLEFNFTVGEALSCIGAGYLSSAARDKWQINTEKRRLSSQIKNSMSAILKTVIGKYATSTANYDKQAATVWLLSIVKFAPGHPDVKEMMQEIQSAFMELLASSDEITQEMASRGISLVYEQVGEETRDQLVSILVERLTTGKRPAQKVDANTELFKGASLGSTPDGSSLSTYKELCSLASSLNQPDLVYKFMNLANHSAIWNSRKGAAFGFLGIASQAKKQLEPFLPQLIPKLYRYQYDPNPAVQRAMSNIWSAVVPQDKKSLGQYTTVIAKDLIQNMVSYQWRVRESSCIALSDLVRSAHTEDIMGFLQDIWETNFKVLDDIKESVRNSAMICCKTLSKVTVRICDVTQSKSGEQAIAIVLPVLLHVGIASKVDAVKAISLQTLVLISKSAGKLLKPHIAKLVVALLESLSGLEPQHLNTLNLQLSKSKDAQDKLDALRVSASKSSPMMNTINLCVQYIDSQVLTEVVPRLCELIKTGIGLGTKVGCSNFVVSLTLQCRNDLLPFAGKILASLVNGLNTSNNTVRQSFANAIGHLVMFSKASSVEKLTEKLRGWYLEKDSSRQVAVAWILRSISRYSPDILKSHSSAVLPIVFLAMHQEVSKESDSDDGISSATKDAWDEIWQNSTPGTSSGIKLHMDEIFDMVASALLNQSWKLKAQAAKSIETIADSLGSSLSQPYLGRLISILIDALPGRTWDGKEQLLKSLSSICKKCKESIEASCNTVSPCPDVYLIVDAMLKECKRENLRYKMVALESVSSVLEAYQIDRFEAIADIVRKYLTRKEKGENDDEIEEKSMRDTFVSSCIDSIGKSWPSTESTQESFCVYILEIITRLLNSSVWRVQLSLLRSSEAFFTRLKWKSALNDWKFDENTSMSAFIFGTLLIEIFTCIDDTMHSSVRIQGISSVLSMLQALKELTDVDINKDVKERLKTIAIKHKESTNYELSKASLQILQLIE